MTDLTWYLYLAVIAAGFAAGFINTLAGSGSLITLPLLIFLGLPANVAGITANLLVLFTVHRATRGMAPSGNFVPEGGAR